MEKSKIVMGILAAATLGACQSSKVKISGRLVGADARQVYIEQLSAGGKAPLIDSVSLDDAGNYRFELKNVPSTPSLYTISYNGESVPVLIEGGDRLTINSAGSFARNYTVEGNEESSLLREFNLAYVEGAEKLNDIAAAYARNALPKPIRTNTCASSVRSSHSSSNTRRRSRRSMRFRSACPAIATSSTGRATPSTTARWPMRSKSAIPSRPIWRRSMPRFRASMRCRTSRRRSPKRVSPIWKSPTCTARRCGCRRSKAMSC